MSLEFPCRLHGLGGARNHSDASGRAGGIGPTPCASFSLKAPFCPLVRASRLGVAYTPPMYVDRLLRDVLRKAGKAATTEWPALVIQRVILSTTMAVPPNFPIGNSTKRYFTGSPRAPPSHFTCQGRVRAVRLVLRSFRSGRASLSIPRVWIEVSGARTSVRATRFGLRVLGEARLHACEAARCVVLRRSQTEGEGGPPQRSGLDASRLGQKQGG